MHILEQLGLNKTYFVQLIIFVLCVFILSIFVFKDYLELLSRRNFMTKGSEDLAEEFQKITNDLQQEYESKARQVSGEIKKIFDNYREEAGKEYQNIISKAKAQAARSADEVRRMVTSEVADAAGKLSQEAPALAQAVTAKLLGKSESKGKRGMA